MHLDRLTTLSVSEPLLRTGVFEPRPGIPILMYHSISAGTEPNVSPYYRVRTSPERFRQHLAWLHDAGYRVISLDEAVASLSAGTAGVGRRVALTFDDGFHDFLTEAWPALQQWGFTATVFVPTAFIGGSRKAFKGRDCLTWPEMRQLQSCGITFGSHTESHRKLNDLEWRDVRQELSRSKATLEAELQKPIRQFAYPYAFPQEDQAFARRLKGELNDQGYATAVTTMIGRVVGGSDPLALRRLPVNECDDRRLLMAKVAGAYDWLGDVQRIFRRTKSWSRASRSA